MDGDEVSPLQRFDRNLVFSTALDEPYVALIEL